MASRIRLNECLISRLDFLIFIPVRFPDMNARAINTNATKFDTYLAAWYDGGVWLQPSARDWEQQTQGPTGNGKIAFHSF
jgi:hypothetical protein